MRPGFHVEGRTRGAAGPHVKRPKRRAQQRERLVLDARTKRLEHRTIDQRVHLLGGGGCRWGRRRRDFSRQRERGRAPRRGPVVPVLVDVDAIGARVRVRILFVVGTLFGTLFGTFIIRVFVLIKVVDALGAHGDDAVLEVAVVGRERRPGGMRRGDVPQRVAVTRDDAEEFTLPARVRDARAAHLRLTDGERG